MLTFSIQERSHDRIELSKEEAMQNPQANAL